MNDVLDSSIQKIAFNEFVQGDAFRKEAEKSKNTEDEAEIVLDEKGNPTLKK